MSVFEVERSGPLKGSVRVLGDKSLTHRAYLFAAMAQPGVPSIIYQPLNGADCESTLQCLVDMGADADHFEAGEQGADAMTMVFAPERWTSPEGNLDCGNSGTTMRLLAGILAGRPGLAAILVGDASLSKRPMGRVATPLRLMGASVEGDTPPLSIHGQHLRGIEYVSPVASAQVKSCVLLAGLAAQGETWVQEPSLSRDHTERMLESLGVNLMRDERGVGVVGGATWAPFTFTVPGDISSAAFFAVAGAMIPGSEVRLTNVGVNPTRSGLLEVLEAAGANVTLEGLREDSGEPVADLIVRGDRDLKAFEISGDLVPRLIDEIPVLAVLATQCRGRTIIRDAQEIRVKESDRIATMAEGLIRMGADVKVHEDGMEITGPTTLTATEVEASHDHRIAMSFAIAGLVAKGTTQISGAESIQTSYPDFQEHLRTLQGR